MSHLISPDNQMFVLARRGRRLTQVVLACVLAVLFAFVAPLPTSVLAFFLLPQSGADASPLAAASQLVIALIIQFVPIVLALWAWVRFYEHRPFWTLGLEQKGAVRKYMRGLLVGLILFALAVGITTLLGEMAYESGDPQQQGLNALGGVLLVYLGWTVQGPTEELLCRGWLMPTVGARYRPWLGVVVSAAVFTLLHALNPNLSLLALVNLCLFGLFAALYALWEGSLWGVAALHAAWNWAQGNLFGLEVSGQPVTGGILLNLRETGSDLITGGPFGPEAGLAVTTVLIGGILVLVLLLRRFGNQQKR